MDQTHLPFVLDDGRTNDARVLKNFGLAVVNLIIGRIQFS